MKKKLPVFMMMLLLLLSTAKVARSQVSGMSRAELLKTYAPIFHMGVNTGSDYYDSQDLIVGVDQDKNWGTYDDDVDVWATGSNWPRTTCARDIGSVNPNENDITPIIYGSVIELADFYVLCYEIYHTYNEIAGGSGDHLNDIEGVNVLVDKAGNIKGATSVVHSNVCWATPWSSDDDGPDIFDVYNNETYKLWLDGTHPQFWIGSNGNADLIYWTHGHAIFPFYQKMNNWGVSYSIANDDVPVKPTSIGYKNGSAYYASAKYIIVPEEELLVKDQMGTSLDQMYRTGQGMGTWSGQFWGNGYYGYIDEGDGSSQKHIRKRYNDSYSGPDMSFNYMYNPPKGMGAYNSDWPLATIGNLTLGANIRSFFKNKSANLPGSGFFDNAGASSNDLLSMSRTASSGNAFTIEAMVRRVGKIHLNSGWYSNPFSKSYVNGTGPTGGIMLRAGLGNADNFAYIGWAPENDKIVYMQRSATLNGGQTTVEYLNISSFNRYFKVENSSNGTITIYAKDYRYPNNSWQQIKQVSKTTLGLDGNIYGALLTQSDINSTEGYYWTNGEYDYIKTTGLPSTSSIEPGYYKIVSRNSGKALDVSGISTADGANVCQWDYVGGYNQQWSIEEIESGVYKIVARHSGKVLDLAGYSTVNGGNIQQYAWYNQTNQKWKIEAVDGTYYKISSLHSSKVLNVAGISQSNGANVDQWDYVGQSNQQWELVKVADLLKSAQIGNIVIGEETPLSDFQVFPNPVSEGVANLVFFANTDDLATVKVYSTTGQLVNEETRDVTKGKNRISIQLNGIDPGVYVVELAMGKDRKIERLIVK